MLVLSPSAEAGPLVVSSAPIPITTNPKLVNQLSLSRGLASGPRSWPAGPACIPAKPTPSPSCIQCRTAVKRTRSSSRIRVAPSTIDLNQMYVYATISGDTPMVETFEYVTI